MVLKRFLITTERPINKADKSGAAQIELEENLEPPAAQLRDTQKPGRGLVKSLRLWPAKTTGLQVTQLKAFLWMLFGEEVWPVDQEGKIQV